MPGVQETFFHFPRVYYIQFHYPLQLCLTQAAHINSDHCHDLLKSSIISFVNPNALYFSFPKPYIPSWTPLQSRNRILFWKVPPLKTVDLAARSMSRCVERYRNPCFLLGCSHCHMLVYIFSERYLVLRDQLHIVT